MRWHSCAIELYLYTFDGVETYSADGGCSEYNVDISEPYKRIDVCARHYTIHTMLQSTAARERTVDDRVVGVM